MKIINSKPPVRETPARALVRALAYMMADRYVASRLAERLDTSNRQLIEGPSEISPVNGTAKRKAAVRR
jgi:hypothetical protein